MNATPKLMSSSRRHALWHCPDTPVLYFSPDRLQATARQFRAGFDGLVTYAVKANDHPAVLDNLIAAGLRAFDVASVAEMTRVRAALPDAVLHYHNPVRSTAEIARAQDFGIQSWSVDCPNELAKLAEVTRTEVAVRLRLPVTGAAYDFGAKFGADPDLAVNLLRKAQAMGFAPSITFHPGTQCADPQAWALYIQEAAKVARRAGIDPYRLNVGGGFAAHRHGPAPDLAAIFNRIAAEARHAFGTPPPLVCEPGRAMVAEAFTLCLRVKAVRSDGAIFLNDGVYGALTELRDIGAPDRIEVVAPDGKSRAGKMKPRVVFGPTCDSLDRLPDPLALPRDTAEGDFVFIKGMGAYAASISTRFNGYGSQQVVTVTQP